MTDVLSNLLQAGHYDGVYLVKVQDRDIYREETIFRLIRGAPKDSKGPLPRVMIKGSHVIDENGSAGVIIGIREKRTRVSSSYLSIDLIIRVGDSLSSHFDWPKPKDEKPISGSLDDIRSRFTKPRGGK